MRTVLVAAERVVVGGLFGATDLVVELFG